MTMSAAIQERAVIAAEFSNGTTAAICAINAPKDWALREENKYVISGISKVFDLQKGEKVA